MNSTDIFKQFRRYPTYSRFSGLLAPHGVAPDLVLNAVYAAVCESIDGLMVDAKYTTEQLCGDEVWDAWASKGQHRAIGICLSFLVATEVVPLVCVSPAHIPNKRYSRKPLTD